MAKIYTQNAQCADKESRTTISAIAGVSKRRRNEADFTKKLFDLRNEYPHPPEMRETEMRERGTSVNMRIMFAKDEQKKHTKHAHRRKNMNVGDVETPSLPKKGEIHQRLKKQCTGAATLDIPTDNERPNDIARFQ